MVSFTSRPLYHRERTPQYSWNRRLDEPQNRSDRSGGQTVLLSLLNTMRMRARNMKYLNIIRNMALDAPVGRLHDVLSHTLRLLNQQGRTVISTDKHLYVWSTRSPTELRLFCALFVGRQAGRHLSLRDTSDLQRLSNQFQQETNIKNACTDTHIKTARRGYTHKSLRTVSRDVALFRRNAASIFRAKTVPSKLHGVTRQEAPS